jgi:hypothetical protein
MSRQAELPGGAAVSALLQRVGRLEEQVGAVIEAVEVLARGFEDVPTAAEWSEADEEHAPRARLLLLVKAARQTPDLAAVQTTCSSVPG